MSSRLVGTQQWTIMDTHSNKTSYKLTVLKPDTTYHVKVLTQCLSKLHKTNEVITVRTPEGCEYHVMDLPVDVLLLNNLNVINSLYGTHFLLTKGLFQSDKCKIAT